MKILVVQLARLGDIYQTWPTLLALSRQQGNEVHCLVRSRFVAATKGLPEKIQIKQLPNKNIFTHLCQEQDDLAALELENFCNELVNEKYDQVINLSFSPFSSWLTWKIEPNSEKVLGYTRHADGHFYPVDDSSAYFYGQVGPGRLARLHITRLFSSVARVELSEDDLRYGQSLVGKRKIENSYWTIQLCASDEKKSLNSAQWIYLIRLLAECFPVMFVLVGSQEDFNFAENVKLSTGYHNILNLCGQTTPHDLFEWIGHADLHLCPDSMTVHIASLVDTPTLNISLDCVNFWETGPLAKNSFVLPLGEQPDMHAKDVVSIIQCMTKQQISEIGFQAVDGRIESYKSCSGQSDSTFSWSLTLALYMCGDLPRTNSKTMRLGLEKTLSVFELGLQQIEILKNQENNPTALDVFSQVDQLLMELEFLLVPLAPFFRWFNTERVRIPPGNREQILLKTQSTFTQGHMVVSRLIEESLTETVNLCR